MTEEAHSSTHPPLPPTTEEIRHSWLRLLRSKRIGPVTFHRLLAEYGSAQNALDALPEVARSAGIKGYEICPANAVDTEIKAAKAAIRTVIFDAGGGSDSNSTSNHSFFTINFERETIFASQNAFGGDIPNWCFVNERGGGVVTETKALDMLDEVFPSGSKGIAIHSRFLRLRTSRTQRESALFRPPERQELAMELPHPHRHTVVRGPTTSTIHPPVSEDWFRTNGSHQSS